MDSPLLHLPHRPPFRFVDAITDVEPGVAGRGTKTFAPDEAFFAGHFPGNPIVPGVILTEALAQLSGIVAAAAEPGAAFLLSAIRQMKFFQPVRPEELLELSARKTGNLGPLIQFEVIAKVGDIPVAEGALMLTRTSEA
ncbi:MAG TPA: 3-hydroxyacyl-ACP dehydratase FabZ family protein [Chthoniobacterales bacterium]|jgi:3-hydroxyacyl-[acyl-carrier-protein] dehydratase